MTLQEAPSVETVTPSSARRRDRSRTAYVARRLLELVVGLWVVVTISFLMVQLIPGDPVRASLGITAPADLVESRRESLGLNDPILTQYWNYLTSLLHGDLGTSFVSQLPVRDVIADRLGATLQLALLALGVVVIGGFTLGLLFARLNRSRHGRSLDLGFLGVSGLLTAMPEFVTAVALTAVFAVSLQWLPSAGMDGAASYVLPVLALGLGPMASMARIVRVEGLRILDEDYLRTARSKRLGVPRVYLLHVLPNSLTATLTVTGLMLSSLVAGTVLVETVFAWPGIGSATVSSITQKDIPMTQGLVLVLGAIVLVVNFLVDMVLTAIDPRTGLSEV